MKKKKGERKFKEEKRRGERVERRGGEGFERKHLDWDVKTKQKQHLNRNNNHTDRCRQTVQDDLGL